MRTNQNVSFAIKDLKIWKKLRDHQQSVHKDYFEFHDEQVKREPAPGDVTVF